MLTGCAAHHREEEQDTQNHVQLVAGLWSCYYSWPGFGEEILTHCVQLHSNCLLPAGAEKKQLRKRAAERKQLP
jgi:hypothetical protein